MHPRHPLAALLLAATLAAGLPGGTASAQATPEYVDVSAYPMDDARYEAWLMLRNALRQDFDEICGDTFCEGDYSNIEPLRFRCSVERTSGRIGMCAWMFAASNEEIDPATGRVVVAQRGFWRCRAPLAKGTTLIAFLDALQGPRPLYAALPGTSRTLMDGLIDCL